MNRVITEITAKFADEECKVDVDKLHEILLALPAEKYIDLYHAMKSRIEGKLFYSVGAEEINYPIGIDWSKYAYSIGKEHE